ncbi:MAG: helix-hairpin-helix domain-containing protein [Bacteroidales bacterium]|nr:helix-hairpin-helix domain-containing protein [Bacteroidales bacterium]
MKLRLHLICAALVISLTCLDAQDHLPGHIISLLEDIAGSSDENYQAINLAEELSYLLENPVNINSGDVKEIKRLFFLTIFQAASIVDYTNKNGDIISVVEISYIPGFDRELAEIMQPFIIYKDSHNNHRPDNRYHFRLTTNILADDGETEADFTGSKYKLLSKLRLFSGPFEASLTLDKDKGEPLLLQGYKPDFLSGNTTYYPEGLLNKIIIGDYKVQFGQGLTVWNGFSRPPVPTEQRIMKGSSNIIPYSSTDENDFFRGVAISLNTKGFNIISFASMNMIDASTGYDENSGTKYIKSFYYNGVHNTPNTIMKRNQVMESCIGFNVNRMSKNFYTGINAVYTGFSLPVMPVEDIRNIYDFRGKVNASFSFDYACLFRSSYLFGEFALDNYFETAFLQGISLNPEGRIRCNIMYSRVNRGYNSFHGNASGVSTFNKPASSLLANLSSELTSFLSLSGGFLRQKELWFNNISGNFPHSTVYLLSLSLKPAGFISIISDVKHRISDQWINPQQGIKTGTDLKKTNLRLSVETVASEQLKLRTRFEKVLVTGSTDRGFLCYQSAGYVFRKIPLEIRGRLTLFKTGSYDTRIYTWEDDLLYNPVIKPLYEEGKRSYLMIIYRAFGRMTLRVKYAVTDIEGEPESSCRLNEIRLQVVLSL